MNNVKFCPQCGSQILDSDRFCGDCGFDTQTTAGAGAQLQNVKRPTEPLKDQKQAASMPPPCQPEAGRKFNSDTKSKNALITVIIILLLIFAGGGGLYWWLSKGEDPGKTTATVNSDAPRENVPDLSRAATYLPKPWLKCSFLVSYPDGIDGEMERITALVVPSKTVNVSEVELNKENGETFGYGFHYVERADGIYYIYDDTPMEAWPVLKNNLNVGQTWNYEDEFGQVVWKVVDMGVSLDLGFTTLTNCLLLEEDNQAVGLRTITYYAPGMGRVMVKSSVEGEEYLRLTAFSGMDEKQAADVVKKWAPNFADIHDDRTQN